MGSSPELMGFCVAEGTGSANVLPPSVLISSVAVPMVPGRGHPDHHIGIERRITGEGGPGLATVHRQAGDIAPRLPLYGDGHNVWGLSPRGQHVTHAVHKRPRAQHGGKVRAFADQIGLAHNALGANTGHQALPSTPPVTIPDVPSIKYCNTSPISYLARPPPETAGLELVKRALVGRVSHPFTGFPAHHAAQGGLHPGRDAVAVSQHGQVHQVFPVGGFPRGRDRRFLGRCRHIFLRNRGRFPYFRRFRLAMRSLLAAVFHTRTPSDSRRPA